MGSLYLGVCKTEGLQKTTRMLVKNETKLEGEVRDKGKDSISAIISKTELYTRFIY